MKLASVRAQLLGTRPPVERTAATAAFTADVLGELASGRYAVEAWRRFWGRSWLRSVETARERPRAAAEVHLLHAMLLAATADPRIGISWVLAWTHLGLMPEGRGLGLPNVLSLLRANLPLLAPRQPHFAALAALASDFADGVIARRSRRETAFGAYADNLADAVFWSWLTWRFEHDRRFRWAAIVLWLLPPAAMAMLTFRSGRLLILPRLRAVRLASAVLQVTLTIRVLRSKTGGAG